ncbi:hypothetical protein FS749_011153, partial [Ceratobasidium sp. UAMH 11750]
RTELPEVQHLAHTFLHTAPDDPLEDFFKDECIVWVLRLLLNGPGAILTGRHSPKSRKPHADMWHIKSITPSLLAFAATVIKFVLSGEPSFEEASGPMNYTNWYLSRLGLLEGVFADEVDTYNSLINYYNCRVLPDRYHEVAFEQPAEEVGAHDNQAGLNICKNAPALERFSEPPEPWEAFSLWSERSGNTLKLVSGLPGRVCLALFGPAYVIN